MDIVNVRQFMDSGLTADEAISQINAGATAPLAIYFPGGEYRFSKPVQIPAQTRRVFGDGIDATTLIGEVSSDEESFLLARRGPSPANPSSQVNVRLTSIPNRGDNAFLVEIPNPPLPNSIALNSIRPGDALLLMDERASSYADIHEEYGVQARDYRAGEYVTVRDVVPESHIIHIYGQVQATYRNDSNPTGSCLPRRAKFFAC